MQGVLAGRYRLERQLGKGGMGSVWLAEHLALRSWVAVKLMDPAIAATPEGAERFRREAQAAASLRSTHVVQVLDYGVHETTPYLVMELLNGESLASCLEREKRLSPERTVAIMTQIARALGRAHGAGIVHRDLKPDNIFLVREDDQELVKILDFGIAKTPQSSFGGLETRTGVTMGTPYYMSPEQVEGKKAVDFRTDLWAMAVITSECLTGVRPFDGSTFGELLLNICARPIAPPSTQGFLLRGFDEWFAKATNRDAEQRFTSAQELATSLKDLVAAASGAHVFAVAPTPQPQYAPTPQPQYAPTPQPQYAPTPQPQYAPTPTHGAAPSVASMSTSQTLPLKSHGALPWILLVIALLVAAVSVTVLVLRPKTSETGAQAPGSTVAATSAAPSALSSIETAASANTATASAAPSKPASVAHAAASTAAAAATPAASAPTEKHEATPPPAVTLAPTKPATTGSRCFSDPFSGLIRPASGTLPANTTTFACRQDPFTGKYKRL